MNALITTRDVLARTGLTEPNLRHVLRRPGAPRPALHPTARVFLWSEDDVRALIDFLRQPSRSEVADATR